ncbi:hypothetical protein ATN88_12505 [Enterovibrio coralii]|uniref:Polyvalent protein metallopeptidase domain-containing protein n=2 Tax=Enterovibrio coralii TaxID=294935 RepID=A0A135I2R3_9GAMM|nr:hypothetical protein ATN88_12505 [Enterovibrio coralii]
MGHPFGSVDYAKEELIAETATLFMCLDEGLETFHAHAKYLEGWASHFSDKKHALLSVCKQAKEAQQFICDKVEAHKRLLAQNPAYQAPTHCDVIVDLNNKFNHELHLTIEKEAINYASLIPLKHQQLLGFDYLGEDGITVYTDKHQRNIYGVAATILEQSTAHFEKMQQIHNVLHCKDKDDEPCFQTKRLTIKP